MPTYTAGEVVTIVAALGVLLTALGAVLVNVIVAVRTTHKVEETAAKTDGLVAQVQQVHTLTNSNLSAVKAELSTANAQIASLLALVQDLKAERDKAATLAALNTPVPGAGVAATLQPQVDNIETTVERTDATINPKE